MPLTLKIPEREELVPAGAIHHRAYWGSANDIHAGNFDVWGTNTGFVSDVLMHSIGVIQNACTIWNYQAISNCTTTAPTTCEVGNEGWRLYAKFAPFVLGLDYPNGVQIPALICAELKYVNSADSVLEKIERLSLQDRIPDALDVVFDAIDLFLERSDFGTIDEILGKASVQSLDKAVAVALLRSTSAASAFLSNWQRFKSEAQQHLTNIGERADILLGGL